MSEVSSLLCSVCQFFSSMRSYESDCCLEMRRIERQATTLITKLCDG